MQLQHELAEGWSSWPVPAPPKKKLVILTHSLPGMSISSDTDKHASLRTDISQFEELFFKRRFPPAQWSEGATLADDLVFRDRSWGFKDMNLMQPDVLKIFSDESKDWLFKEEQRS